MGISKFEFIIRRNLPDLQGKRVLDIGCNNGVISIHMARLGSREVIGVDSVKYWPEVIEQANFVRDALEWRCQAKYNVRYIDSEIADLPSLDLGTFDVVIALNCLYYLSEENIAKVVRRISEVSDYFLIQCNTRDHRRLGKRPTPGFMLDALKQNGFPKSRLDWPWDRPRKGIVPQRYVRPVVVGTK